MSQTFALEFPSMDHLHRSLTRSLILTLVFVIALGWSGTANGQSINWSQQYRFDYGPSPVSALGKYAAGATWSRFDVNSLNYIWVQRFSLSGSTGGVDCGKSSGWWRNDASTLRNGNGYLAYSNSSTSHKTNCGGLQAGSVVAWNVSHSTSTGKFSQRIVNYVNAGGIGTVIRDLRVKDRDMEWFNVNTWIDMDVGNTVP